MLFATDPERELLLKVSPNKEAILKRDVQAKKYLQQVVQVRRDVLKQATDLDSSLLTALLPENSLPYVIHLLAHLPEFTQDGPQYRNTYKYVGVF